MYYYCLTVRKCTPVSSVSQAERVFKNYEYYMNEMKRLDERMHIEYHYECVTLKNGKFNIHVHGMLKTPKRDIIGKQMKGYSIRIEHCKCVPAWRAYITKDGKTKDDIIRYMHLVTVTPILEDSADDDLPDAPEMNVIYKKKLF